MSINMQASLVQQHNMVLQQVQPWNVLDPKILTALSLLPRERFVQAHFQHLAFSEAALPIGFDQVTLPPNVIGKLLQIAHIKPTDKILEIGTGTGYVTALLSYLSKNLTTIEIIPELSLQAQFILEQLANIPLQNETLATFNKHSTFNFLVGDGTQGVMSHAPYDVILLTGSLPQVPKILLEQLTLRGRLIAVIGTLPMMSAQVFTRIKQDQWSYQSIFDTIIPHLVSRYQTETFNF